MMLIAYHAPCQATAAVITTRPYSMLMSHHRQQQMQQKPHPYEGNVSMDDIHRGRERRFKATNKRVTGGFFTSFSVPVWC